MVPSESPQNVPFGRNKHFYPKISISPNTLKIKSWVPHIMDNPMALSFDRIDAFLGSSVKISKFRFTHRFSWRLVESVILKFSTELINRASMRPKVNAIGLSMMWGTHDMIFMVFGKIGILDISTELPRNASMRPKLNAIGLFMMWGTHDSIFKVFGEIGILGKKCLLRPNGTF